MKIGLPHPARHPAETRRLRVGGGGGWCADGACAWAVGILCVCVLGWLCYETVINECIACLSKPKNARNKISARPVKPERSRESQAVRPTDEGTEGRPDGRRGDDEARKSRAAAVVRVLTHSTHTQSLSTRHGDTAQAQAPLTPARAMFVREGTGDPLRQPN